MILFILAIIFRRERNRLTWTLKYFFSNSFFPVDGRNGLKRKTTMRIVRSRSNSQPGDYSGEKKTVGEVPRKKNIFLVSCQCSTLHRMHIKRNENMRLFSVVVISTLLHSIEEMHQWKERRSRMRLRISPMFMNKTSQGLRFVLWITIKIHSWSDDQKWGDLYWQAQQKETRHWKMDLSHVYLIRSNQLGSSVCLDDMVINSSIWKKNICDD